MAAAVELIHMASLVHDDLIDGAAVRHHRASVPAKWGPRVAVFVGDHLCAQAFQLVAGCGDPRLFAILGAQMVAMCEGELQQVVRRGDFSLGEHHCLAMIEKKTASLFQACCGAGAVAAGGAPKTCQGLQEFGFHLGIAFQLLDDCRDLLSDREKLGKSPGQDLRAGDVTLPLLYAMRHGGAVEEEGEKVGRAEGEKTLRPSSVLTFSPSLARVGEAFRSSPAPGRIAELVESCVERARRELRPIVDSDFKRSLHLLADHMAASVSGILAG
jgi:geranylgeranyl pyrophosphate synthase